MIAAIASLLALAAASVQAHYELIRPVPRGVDGTVQRQSPCGGFPNVQAVRAKFSEQKNSIDVQLYWDGNVEVFMAVGDNPVTFPTKIGEQPNAKAGTLYTIPIDVSKVPGLTKGSLITLQTICHFSATVDLYQCADMVYDVDGTEPSPSASASPTASPSPSALPYETQVKNVAHDFVTFLDSPGGCLTTDIHMKPTEPSRNLAALWVRGAFHDAGTYDPGNKAAPGGADGSLAKMLDHPAHKGIKASIARGFLMNKKGVTMGDADLIALAGAVTVGHCGGPMLKFRAGRADNPSPIAPEGRIPEDTDGYADSKAILRRIGFTNEDIVALVVGGHSLGGAHGAISPHITSEEFAPFDSTPGVFDNDIFKQLLAGHCRTNVDCGIANDPELRPLVEKYAADQSAFFVQFEASFSKMTGLTASSLTDAFTLDIPVHKNLTQEGTVNVPTATNQPGYGNNGPILSGAVGGNVGLSTVFATVAGAAAALIMLA
nr:L-ascorbate peroxidase 3 [Polyrhizophydium stewartii]